MQLAKVLRDQKKSTGTIPGNKRKAIAAEMKVFDAFVSKYVRETIVPSDSFEHAKCVKSGCGFSSCDPAEYKLHAKEKGHYLKFVSESVDQ